MNLDDDLQPTCAPNAARPREGTLRAVLVVVWLLGLGIALAALWRYKSTPGPAAHAPTTWPPTSALARVEGRPTLVMFAHPGCACTRASLAELRALVGRFGERVTTYVLFLQPSDEPEDWSKTDTWADAASLAGVRVDVDRDGRESSAFGAEVSGHVVLYDARGELLFSGGITPARGHVGASPQLDKLVDAVSAATRDDGAPRAHAGADGAVYGCTLRGEPR